jgi:hypothetical protein
LITSKFLASELPFHGWKSPEIAWTGQYLDCMVDVLMGFHQSTFFKLNTKFDSDLAPCDFWVFPTTESEHLGNKIITNVPSSIKIQQ